MALKWDDIVVDKRAVMADPGDLLAPWLWLVPNDASPMLPTACGDLFLRLFDGGIAFLDTYEGTCALVAASYEDWKAMLESQDRMEDWFRVSLIGELLEAGQTRAAAQCFSPFVPQIVGGSWESSNFHACNLIVHLTMLSQVHQQVKDLPPGTRIAGFDLVDE